MKKIIILVVVAVVLLGGGVAAYYYGFLQEAETGSTEFVSKWDLINKIDPVVFPMRGYTFTMPDFSEENNQVTLDLVSPGSVRDYPMGRMEREDGSRITLTALDNFLSDEVAGKRAVLLRKNTPEFGDEFYLGIIRINNDQLEHINSLPVSDHIRPRSIRIEGNTVVLNYDVHDRDQSLAETPRINTTATFDLVEEIVLIAGRHPKSEEVIRYKRFSGVYLWLYTDTPEDRIEPIDADAFSLRFNANRIELTTDCNSGNATFATEPLPATSFTVERIATTSMFCESEQEDKYFAMVGDINSYEESEDGKITFVLGDESKMIFVPKERALEFGS